IHLVFVGDGECRTSLEAQVDALDIRDSVTFAGTLRESWNINSLFDIGLLTSVAEGSPNSVIEAMAAGIPVVATRVGGVPEVIRHEVNGFVCDSGDVDEIAKHLTTLASDISLRVAMGAAAYSGARENHSAASTIPRLLT